MKTIKGMSDYAQAIARMHLVSTGIPYEDLDRPIIGVVNSWNEIVPGHVPLREIAEYVKKGIRNAGGLPLEFNTIAICDGIAQGHAGMRYALPSRSLIADSIEAMVLGHDIFDGLVFVTACDKITPAMLMAAARLNLPAVFVTSGPANTAAPASSKKEIRKKYLEGKINEKELIMGSLDFYCGPGICPFLGTANTMLMVAETLGLMLPYTSTIPFGVAGRSIASQMAGERIVELAQKGIRPSEFLTKEAFFNTIKVTLAVGGSLNTLLHLPAIAGEAGIGVSWEDFDRFSQKVPHIAPVTPNGPYSVVNFHNAGGVPAVMKEIRHLLNLSTATVSGETTGEIVARAEVKNRDVIRPVTDPVHPEGGIAVLKGNLAPNGAIVKQSGVKEELRVFTGPARVFNSEEECVLALQAGKVREGDVLVIRYEGPRGGPGMREMHRVTEFVSRFERVAIVTDGRFSGASIGLSVGYLTPEAYEGGPIGLVEDGDEIAINIPARELRLRVPEEDLRKRRALWKPVEKAATRFLQTYRDTYRDTQI
ncbi:MAG: dihydroxy-acid dehydratase [Firmicutes bacterium]|nr:dihydroxy-acid dehydratase [Bacillota bacterium]